MTIIHRITIPIICIFFFALLLSCKKDPYAAYPQGYLLHDVDIPESLLSTEEARELVRKYMNAPIPSNYKTPSYLAAGYSLDSVYQMFYHRYPGFYGKQGQEYLEAIANDPRGYYIMINENKKLRELYREQALAKSKSIDEQIKAQEERWAKARKERGEGE